MMCKNGKEQAAIYRKELKIGPGVKQPIGPAQIHLRSGRHSFILPRKLKVKFGVTRPIE